MRVGIRDRYWAHEHPSIPMLPEPVTRDAGTVMHRHVIRVCMRILSHACASGILYTLAYTSRLCLLLCTKYLNGLCTTLSQYTWLPSQSDGDDDSSLSLFFESVALPFCCWSLQT